MAIRITLTTALLAAALGGCASGSPSQATTPSAQAAETDPLAERIDRMRGCWIARHGSSATFLRLLPSSVGAPSIEGGVDRADTSPVTRVAVIAFERDGSGAHADLDGRGSEPYVPSAPEWGPSGDNWIVYRTRASPTLFMMIEATGETLRIMTTLGPDPGPMSMSPVFEGNRDGCD